MNYTAYQPSTRVDFYRRALLVGLGAQLLAPSAILLAEDASTNAPVEMKKTVIIGSNIPTAETETAQPVDIYDRAKIDRMGVTTVNDLLQRVPQASAQGLNGNNGGTGFASGSTGVSLRGLGLNATLILLNGRRMAPYGFANDGTSAFVDLNSIPLEAVETVEILAAGNSAVYGADAIAGVINIKTKRDYRGGELSFWYGNTQHQDAATVKGSITFGAGNDKTDVMIVADYYHQNDLYNRDRSFSSFNDQTPYGGANLGSSFGYPGRFGVPGDAPGLVGTPFEGTGGNLVPPANTDGHAPAGSYHNFGDADRYNFNSTSQATPLSERMGAYATFNHKIFDEKVQVFGDFMFRHGEEHIELAPSPLDISGAGAGQFIPLGTVIVDHGVRTVGNQLTIPASNPFNPFGVDITEGRVRLFETGNRTQDVVTDAFRLLGGLRGEVNEYFNYETAVLFNRAQTISTSTGVQLKALQDALNDPDPATSLNLFSGPDSPNNPATLAGLKAKYNEIGTTELLSWDAKFYGDIFDLPGGTLKYAAGVEYRTEQFSDLHDQLQLDGAVVGQQPSLDNNGRRDVTSAYVETIIPITGPKFNVLPFYRLDITAAGRLDSYSDFGESEVPTIGIQWRPFNEDLMLRASYAENFRPASLQQLFNHSIDSLSGTPFNDPLRGDLVQEVNLKNGGNPNLQPETATQWTAGLVWSPKQVKGLKASVDWLQIKRKNEIGTTSDFFGYEYLAQQAGRFTRTAYEGDAAFMAANPGLPIPAIDPATGQPYGRLVALNDSYANIGATITDSIDFRLSYELPTDTAGTWTFEGLATYLLSYRILDPGTGDYIPQDGGLFYAGTDALPKWRATGSVFWDYRKLSIGLFANYIGEVDYPNSATGDLSTVDSFITFDMQASYKLPWDVKVTVGVNNIADAAPPLYLGSSSEGYAYLSSLENPFLRTYYFQLSKKF
ncbi:MAG TPA: TonB-dependent receptor [Candidatus Limnocylindria bacterium]|jgi:outer membrane receptor protein involved in Fe transport|nr:TonB-dependent receptor [Candidatus Limnocylindria bacterium]